MNSNTFFQTTECRARKQHVCDECLLVIQPGWMYARLFGVQDGSGWSAKHCLDCREAVEWHLKACPWEKEIEIGGLAAHLVDCLGLDVIKWTKPYKPYNVIQYVLRNHMVRQVDGMTIRPKAAYTDEGTPVLWEPDMKLNQKKAKVRK